MTNKTLIFSATYNEAKNIEEFLNLIFGLNIDFDILIIDDNSPDKTYEIIEKFVKDKQNTKLIVREKKMGLDTAHKMAFEHAKNNSYNYLITLDADLSHDPTKIPIFLKELQNNPFVVGSRYIPGCKCGMKGFRLFMSYMGNIFIKTIFNIDCRDFTSGYRGFNLQKLDKFNLAEVTSKGYSFFMETIYKLNYQNIPIKQIPIYFPERKKGKSKIPKIELIRTLLNVLKLKLKKD